MFLWEETEIVSTLNLCVITIIAISSISSYPKNQRYYLGISYLGHGHIFIMFTKTRITLIS